MKHMYIHCTISYSKPKIRHEKIDNPQMKKGKLCVSSLYITSYKPKGDTAPGSKQKVYI